MKALSPFPAAARATALRRGLCVALLLVVAFSAKAEALGDGIGIRGGAGTDVTFGGAALGAGVNALFSGNVEIGLVGYYGKFSNTSNNGYHTYDDTTQITAVAAFLNYLYGYRPGQSGWHLVGGVGLAYLGVYWEERSRTDTSLGTLLPGGGSMQDFEGSVGGTLVNLGVGYAFARGLDLRLEVPIVITLGEAGGASRIIPLSTLTLGYRFGSK